MILMMKTPTTEALLNQISQFLRRTQTGMAHWCPACEEIHIFHTKRTENGSCWRWNGNIIHPTFMPSMVITCLDPIEGKPRDRWPLVSRCHYWLKNGKLEFLTDCTHRFKGITVSLPPLPAWLRDANA
jgi:hypothetical protein